MVKLSFSSDYLLGLQVSRTPKIEILNGSISTLANQSLIIVRSKGQETLSLKGQKTESKAVFSKQMPDKVVLPQTDTTLFRPVPRAGGARSTKDTLASSNPNAKPLPKPSILAVIKNPKLAKTTYSPRPVANPSPRASSIVKVAPLPPLVKAANFSISEPIANAKFNAQLDNGVPLVRTILRALRSPLIPKAQVILRSPQGVERALPIDFDRNGDGAITVTFNRPGN